MPSSYLPVLISLIFAVCVPIILIIVPTVLGGKVPHAPKEEPYECGVPGVGSVRERFPVKFYRVAILFLLFDVEAAFLFPWAVLFRSKVHSWGGTFLVLELVIFLFILVAGYVYAWKKGALEWD